jgi:hypothetical protein
VIVRRLIFEDAERIFRVMIADEAAKHMFRLCNANRSQETGGILTGSYSSDYTRACVGAEWDIGGFEGLHKTKPEVYL